MTIRMLSTIGAVVLVGALGVSPSLWSAGRPARSSLSTLERLAVERLRQIHFAQERFKSVLAVDADHDGKGECATLGELASTVPLRSSNETLARFLSHSGQAFPFSKALGQIDAHGWAEADDYFFAVYLPNVAGAPQPEQASGGILPRVVAPDLAETYWAVYAWPKRANGPKHSTFMINQQGVVFVTADTSGYKGATVPPDGLSAYLPGDDMTGLIPVDGAHIAADGYDWSVLDEP